MRTSPTLSPHQTYPNVLNFSEICTFFRSFISFMFKLCSTHLSYPSIIYLCNNTDPSVPIQSYDQMLCRQQTPETRSADFFSQQINAIQAKHIFCHICLHLPAVCPKYFFSAVSDYGCTFQLVERFIVLATFSPIGCCRMINDE